jgi:hypothetical protein
MKDEVGRECSRYGVKRNSYSLQVGKSEGKRPLGRSTSRWVENIKLDLVELEWGGVH